MAIAIRRLLRAMAVAIRLPWLGYSFAIRRASRLWLSPYAGYCALWLSPYACHGSAIASLYAELAVYGYRHTPAAARRFHRLRRALRAF